MVPLPSECRESKVRYPAPWGGKGGNASSFQGLPWGIDTFHSQVCVLDGSLVPKDAGETTLSVPVSRSGTKVLSFRTIPQQTLGRK